MKGTRKKISVLHIITHLNVGGAQDNTLITLERLDKTRYDISLLCGPRGEWLERAHAIPGLRMILIKELIRKIHIVYDLLALMKMYSIIRRERFDVVHTHSSKPGFSGRIAARLAGVPVVIHTIHGFPFNDTMHPWVKAFFIGLERALSPCADVLVTVSHLNQGKAIRLGLGKKDQFVNIYSGISFEHFDGPFNVEAKKRELGVGAGERVVGMVGRLSVQKSPMTLLNAVPAILKEAGNVRVVVTGDGELRPAVEKEIRRLGIQDHVTLLGFREDIPEIMAIFDVFVLSSLWEGLGRSLTEAMYMGLPVVATRVEGVPELVEDGKTGKLVQPGDPEEVARAVIDLLKHPEEARLLGKNAKQRVMRDFSDKRMVAEIEELYRRLLRSKGSTESVHVEDR